jgi:hypothetical protein
MSRAIAMLWNVGVIEGELPKEIYSDPPIRRMHHAMGAASQLKSRMTGNPDVSIDKWQLMEVWKWGVSPDEITLDGG